MMMRAPTRSACLVVSGVCLATVPDVQPFTLGARRGFVGAAGMPGEGDKPWELPKTHHLQNSIGTATPYPTACGRMFDPILYQELIQACVDQSWCQAIQRQLREDSEYLSMLRTEGGGAQTIDDLYKQGGFANDEEFLVKLKTVLTTDKRTSLAVTALQDAYSRLRKKRDIHQTEVAATGHDPYGSMKGRTSFGTTVPTP